MKFFEHFKLLINKILKPFGFILVNRERLIDFSLYEYKSYDHYRDIQIYHNKRKIDHVWADESTLSRVGNMLLTIFSTSKSINGICHGTRNGFEQKFLMNFSEKITCIGTDISDTAKNYDNSFHWDFHDVKEEWLGCFDFVYSNSLDQSWKPKVALQTWLSQLNKNGILIIEHTKAHGPQGASEMDPFGVRPMILPYILTMWFGSQISIEHSVAPKKNNNLDAWLFVIKKNVEKVEILND